MLTNYCLKSEELDSGIRACIAHSVTNNPLIIIIIIITIILIIIMIEPGVKPCIPRCIIKQHQTSILHLH